MYLINQIKLALISLGLNKFRSFLTMLGIIIGVSAVISVVAVGAGAQSLILDQINSLGTNIIGIMPGKSEEMGPPAAVFGTEITSLKNEDADAMKNIEHVTGVYSYITGHETVTYLNKSKDYDYTGTTSGYVDVLEADIAQGNFFSDQDNNSLSRVIVLGSQVKEDLFNADDALNKTVRIKQVSFKVIGVMEKRGNQGFSNQDELVFIPLRTAQKLLLHVDHVAVIRAKIDKEENMSLVMLQIESLLRYNHHIKDPKKDDFTVRSSAQALDILGAITQGLKIFLAMVAAISLLVGGIGIMNIMLVAVTERTREIGLRKALGAKPRHILNQFLVEAVILTSLGGILGIILGIIIAALISFGVSAYGYQWALIITPTSVVLALVVAWAIGLIFGYWPAKKAAKLEPMQALRYE